MIIWDGMGRGLLSFVTSIIVTIFQKNIEKTHKAVTEVATEFKKCILPPSKVFRSPHSNPVFGCTG